MKNISQSLIRDMLSEDGYCGYYLDLVYNQGKRAEVTDAMTDGLYFEYNLLGATARGEVPEIPKSKTNGAMLKRETDLIRVINQAREICRNNYIVFDRVQVYAERDHLSGHIDAIGTYFHQRYLFDVKYTGMTFAAWEKELKFGNTRANFYLQGRQYQALQEEDLPFMFLVFGDGWARFLELPYDRDDVEHHSQVAADALETFNALDPRPTADSRMCFACRMRSQCDKVNRIINIEQL